MFHICIPWLEDVFTFRFQPDPKAPDHINIPEKNESQTIKQKKISVSEAMLKKQKQNCGQVQMWWLEDNSFPWLLTIVKRTLMHQHDSTLGVSPFMMACFFSLAGDLFLLLPDSLLLHTPFLPWLEFFQRSAKPAIGSTRPLFVLFAFMTASWIARPSSFSPNPPLFIMTL